MTQQDMVVDFLRYLATQPKKKVFTKTYAKHIGVSQKDVDDIVTFLKGRDIVDDKDLNIRDKLVELKPLGKAFLEKPYNLFNLNALTPSIINIGDNNKNLSIIHSSNNSSIIQNVSNIEGLERLYDLIEKSQLIDIAFKDQLLEEIKIFKEKSISGENPKLETFKQLWGFASDTIQILTYLGLIK